MNNLNIIPSPSSLSRISSYLEKHAAPPTETIYRGFTLNIEEISPTAVLIPVAAEQEAINIRPAMHAYSQQKGHEPFTICLLANHRANGYDKYAVDDTLLAIEGVQHEFQDELDIRYDVLSLDEPRIGAIRKCLWDAALLLSLRSDPKQRFIGINHDIDVVSMNPHYIRNVQNEYKKLAHPGSNRPLPPRTTLVSHDYPVKTHPNTSRAIFLQDMSTRQQRAHAGYEAGLVVPFEWYAARGGFSPFAKTYETAPFTASGKAPSIAGTGLKTSPRRYVSHFPDHGFGIWANTENFTSRDDCRDTNAKPPDATEAQLREHVYEALESLTHPYFMRADELADHSQSTGSARSLEHAGQYSRPALLVRRVFALAGLAEYAERYRYYDESGNLPNN